MDLHGAYALRLVFIHFYLKYATEREKISSNRYRIQFEISLYPLSFFANTPFKYIEHAYL